MVEPYGRTNRAVYDRLAVSGSRFAKVASDEECRQPLATLDSRGWLPKSVAGWNVLCLGSGGGWQSILYALAGANVTVVDISPEMLRLDIREAERRGVKVRTVEASMESLPDLRDAEFDLVHQPVSTCYVASVKTVFAEVARVLKDNGLYISQHKTPTSLQLVSRDERERYVIGIEYYHEGPLPKVADDAYREPGAVEYLHRWEELVGELCRQGFWIEDFCEPRRSDPLQPPGHFGHRGRYVAPYVRMKARRRPRASETSPPPAETTTRLWTP